MLGNEEPSIKASKHQSIDAAFSGPRLPRLPPAPWGSAECAARAPHAKLPFPWQRSHPTQGQRFSAVIIKEDGWLVSHRPSLSSPSPLKPWQRLLGLD